MDLIYCYGVIGIEKSEHDSALLPISGFGNVSHLNYKNIVAVMSSVSNSDFSQEAIDAHVRDMTWLAANAPVHEKVVDAYNRVTTIVPMKFCTVFKTTESLLEMLKAQYAHFITNLEYLHGKVEMSVKGYVDYKHAKVEMMKLHPELQQEIDKAEKLSPGKSYFERKKIEEKIDSLIQEFITTECSEVESFVKNNSLELKKKAVVEQKGSHILFNIACLIQKKEIDKFSEATSTIGTVVIKTVVTGPFAAYDFIH